MANTNEEQTPIITIEPCESCGKESDEIVCPSCNFCPHRDISFNGKQSPLSYHLDSDDGGDFAVCDFCDQDISEEVQE